MEPTPHFATIPNHAASQRTRMVNSLAAHQPTRVEQMVPVNQRSSKLLEPTNVNQNHSQQFAAIRNHAVSQR